MAILHEKVNFLLILVKLINSGDVGVMEFLVNLNFIFNILNVFKSHFGLGEDFDGNDFLSELMDSFVDFGIGAYS